MHAVIEPWDYLVVTASNEEQARAYEQQLELRRALGFLSDIREVLVVADPGGKRVGSGGSTLFCLMTVLNRELPRSVLESPETGAWEEALRRLRILIVHAGGDSKRLPAYGPCGKIFIPVPGESDRAIGTTLFDRQLPVYLALPPTGAGRGQVVITAGDVLLGFDPAHVHFSQPGITGLGCHATPEQASKHGVFCAGTEGRVSRFLQKPSPAEQLEGGAVDRYGRSNLDIGVMSFDAATAAQLLRLCGAATGSEAGLQWSGGMGAGIEQFGLDFYREIACALGEENTLEQYIETVRRGGSKWPEALLGGLYEGLSDIPFHVQTLAHCSFLHFGTLRQIVSSGLDLLRQDRGAMRAQEILSINNAFSGAGRISGGDSWVEGCRLHAELRLGGDNVVVGANIAEPLTLPAGACLDVLRGTNRNDSPVCFFRLYAADDDFKGTAQQGATVWGVPLAEICALAQCAPEALWDATVPETGQGVWNAKLFPAESEAEAYRKWLWLWEPRAATAEQWKAWRNADRYSLAQIATRTDQAYFHARRLQLRTQEILQNLTRMLRPDSGLSAFELAFATGQGGDPVAWILALIAEAQRHDAEDDTEPDLETLNVSRIIHSLGTLVSLQGEADATAANHALAEAEKRLGSAEKEWLEGRGLQFGPTPDAQRWAVRAKAFAFHHIGHTISASGAPLAELPKNALRKDEIVWGRAPARLDLGGGWSDTPPYALERGGCVINAAVNLNGQAPIHAYARVIAEPVIRLSSIDFGERVEIRDLEKLLDYRHAGSEFSLPKAALALSGFSPEFAPWPKETTLEDMLQTFGGGIEITTLAAIPGGSGLGTSSIVGAVVLAVVQRVMGRELTHRELFHGVLRLEQALTTGGGWQDQVGGAIGGVKTITTQPGLVPDPLIHYIPSDVLDTHRNGGCTLLYYTGITRMAKNILQNVVGRYLDRERSAMATLERIHAFPDRVADAMARRDLPAFGRAIGAAWELKKQIDPGATTPEIEHLLQRMHPYLFGAKLMGAGGGGFLLLVCRSSEAAQALRSMLEAEPPNDRARFFDFALSEQGLVVTVC